MSNRFRSINTPSFQVMQWLAVLADLLGGIDLVKNKANGGSHTPNTPASIDTLAINLPVLHGRIDGFANLKARSDAWGDLEVTRNDDNLAVGVWVSPADNTPLGYRELVLGVNARSGRPWVSQSIQDAMKVIEAILADPQVHLRGVARDANGNILGDADLSAIPQYQLGLAIKALPYGVPVPPSWLTKTMTTFAAKATSLNPSITSNKESDHV